MKQFIIFSVLIALSASGISQPIDFTNCPTCTTRDIEQVKEINTKYQGVEGRNPSVPSTYRLIGSRKFSNTGWKYLYPSGLPNWLAVRVPKQIFKGKFDHFAVNTYGDESDWDIYMTPSPGFDDFINEALPYKFGGDIFPFNWPKDINGNYCVEAEITPPNEKYGNLWFNNNKNGSFTDAFNANNYLIGKTICAYGPFVMELTHGNHPEIHPSEQIWWKENDNITNILLVGDGSNRFDGINDFIETFAIPSYKPWTPTTNLEAELKIPFSLNPSKEAVYYNITAIDDHNFYNGANYSDASSGTSHKIEYAGKTVLTVEEPIDYDSKIGITFSNVCYNSAKGILQGFIVINTATGNGNGKEGFVLLQIDKRETKFNQKPVLKWGNLLNSWKVFNPAYDNNIYFESIIASDKTGKGIVDGVIDFNGNGIIDFFAVNGGNWMVLYDGKGEWKKINSSHIPVDQLRFVDANGDKKTDVLFVDLDGVIFISHNGTDSWTEISETNENYRDVRVGDFNGDGKTDLIYFKTHAQFNPLDKDTADMYIKYSCKDNWKLLNENYVLNKGDFDKYFRFGHFNKDNKTDVFRYDNNRFLAYWGGTGSYEVLNNNPATGLKMNNLLFANNFTQTGITDVIYVDQENKKWIKYDGGGAGTLPMPMDFSNPDKIHFASTETGKILIPVVMDYIPAEPGYSEQIVFEKTTKAETESFIKTEYKPGTLRKNTGPDGSSFVYDMDVMYYPGTNTTNNDFSKYSTISRIKGKTGTSDLAFKPGLQQNGEGKLLGKIEAVKINSKEEEEFEISFSNNAKKYNVKSPAYSIGALPASISETAGAAGSWNKWVGYLSRELSTQRLDINGETKVPGKVEKINIVQFELFPFYSSLERGNVSMVEMGAPMEELNSIVYGNDKRKITDLYGGEKVFTIKWTFELKNVTTNKIISTETKEPVIANGKWMGNKIDFSYPDTDDLLQLTATAIITDALGTVAVKPIELVFYNQRVIVSKDESVLKLWINSVGSAIHKEYLLKRITYFSEKGKLSPSDIVAVFK